MQALLNPAWITFADVPLTKKESDIGELKVDVARKWIRARGGQDPSGATHGTISQA